MSYRSYRSSRSLHHLCRVVQCAVLFPLLGGCCGRASTRTASSAPPAAELPGWSYEARVGPGAASLTVDMCFAGRPPATVTALLPNTWELIDVPHDRNPWLTTGPTERTLDLANLPPGQCLSYVVALDRLRTTRSGRDRWIGSSLLLRYSRWLLWPRGASKDARVTLTLDLLPGQSASVPWQEITSLGNGSTTYHIPADSAGWLGYTALGTLKIDRFTSHGAQIEIAQLDQHLACEADCLRGWIGDAVATVALLYGHYPRDRLQVIVVPTSGTRSSVYFGLAYRGGGSGVMLLVDTHANEEQLMGQWTTVHELLHHGMPFVRDPWMSEGFVSYYTELLMTRRGHRDELAGWMALRDAFARGRRGGRGLTLQATSDAMGLTFAYQRVYWGGAAIAFDIDVSLRLATDNRLGLDDAMTELNRCCATTPREYGADELMAHLDSWYGHPLFSDIARRHLSRRNFAAVDDIFSRIGVTISEDTLIVDEAHPAADIRRSMMTGANDVAATTRPQRDLTAPRPGAPAPH